MHGFIHVLQPIRPSRAAQHLAEVASLENLKVAVERRSLMSDDGSIEWDSRTVTFPEGNHRTLGGLSNHRSVAVAAIQSTSTIMVRMHGFIHVLQRRNETHERMFLHIGMFLRMFSNLLNTGCGRGVRLWALDTADIFGLVT